MEPIARSLLFVPGGRPERFDKAAGSGAHQVVIDLEDAVAPGGKEEARKAALAWLERGNPAMVRINGADTEWFQPDLEAMASLPAGSAVMLPKADVASIRYVLQALPGRTIVALIETAQGYFELRQLAAIPEVTRLAFGSVDFGVETGIADESDAMTAIRTQIVLESCYAGLAPPVDGVSLNLQDEERMRGDARRSHQLGFGGKLCIHPRQVVAVNQVFCPDEAQVEWAQRVVDAFETSEGGVTTVDGKMVDKPVAEQARRILAEARARQG